MANEDTPKPKCKLNTLLQYSMNLFSLSYAQNIPFDRMDVSGGLAQRTLVQCRICHDEDEASNMETPCACSGSLKYAHRRCVQMWCNEKGNTICEICQQVHFNISGFFSFWFGWRENYLLTSYSLYCMRLQQFKPGYSPPPPRLPVTVFPLHLREPWEFPRSDQDHHPSIVGTQRNFFEHSFDEYPVPTASIVCCRIIAIIFVVLLVLRHTLPIVLNGAGEYSYTLYILLMLRTIGILLPMCVMLKACSIIRNRRRHRLTSSSFLQRRILRATCDTRVGGIEIPTELEFATSDGENDHVQPQLAAHFIHVQ
ncbi:hypothetical protein Cgig2_003273 [Carnegiea gigantea]|uniref:RING-CH-type domain-containing protein n=1 Tax=Carnegiea gigantea TaxID=171969 RepID=A0A9Q1GS07_9CARY|nr:hypothetical protein Cgig2_003273 [Carnegiea gigantea]